MELLRFKAYYDREKRRIEQTSTEYTAKKKQHNAFTIQSEYSDHNRLMYALQALESNFNNCGADNLDYIDQITIKEFIDYLKQLVNSENLHQDNQYSVNLIEEMITLANLYLGMQVLNYPSFLRLEKKNYIEENILSNRTEFEIPSFKTSIEELRNLDPYCRVVTRYKRESTKLKNFLKGKKRKYQNESYQLSDDERLEQLRLNMQAIINKIYAKETEKEAYSYGKEKAYKYKALVEYINQLNYHIEQYSIDDLEIYEMMLEIANILFDMKIRNPYAFQQLEERQYMKEVVIKRNSIEIISFEETYSILSGFKKKL